MKKVEWIESAGGPLILLAAPLLKFWSGVNPSDDEGKVPDYRRACEICGEVGVIPISAVQALIIGDEPDRTTAIELKTSVILLRWRWSSSEEALLKEFFSEIEFLEFSTNGEFNTIPGKHHLFDSALSGSGITESLDVDLLSQEYMVETALFQPNKNICALAHRLSPKK